MSDASELVSVVKRQAGSHLRAIAEFDGIQSTLHFVRDDIDEAQIETRLELFHDINTWSWSPSEDKLAEELGPKRASLQLRQQAVIIHLPTGTDQGILIGLEPEAATDLTAFLKQCVEHIPD
jgi:hypothetical protein